MDQRISMPRSRPVAAMTRTGSACGGRSEATPYHHFRDKTAVLADRRGERGEKTSRDRLLGIGLGYVRFALAHRGRSGSIFGSLVVALTLAPELRE